MSSGRRLRIVTWNANMALHSKLPTFVDRLRPDVAILSEVACEDVLRRKLPSGYDEPFTMIWMGENPNKGLAVLAFGDYSVEVAEVHDPRLQWILAAVVNGPVEFQVLAVWAFNRRATSYHPDHFDTIPPIAALEVYRDWITNEPTMFAGDFNHNVYWDRPGSPRNHARTVDLAAGLGLTSVYHHWFSEEQGAEARPTIYWRDRTVDGPTYHIDYAFLPQALLGAVTNVEVGAFDDWVATRFSDHVPIVIDIDA